MLLLVVTYLWFTGLDDWILFPLDILDIKPFSLTIYMLLLMVFVDWIIYPIKQTIHETPLHDSSSAVSGYMLLAHRTGVFIIKN